MWVRARVRVRGEVRVVNGVTGRVVVKDVMRGCDEVWMT